MADEPVRINRAPVLCLWAATVAERLGYDRPAALSLGRVCAGLNAQAKGRAIGLFSGPAGGGGESQRSGLGEDGFIQLCGRPVPYRRIDDGVRGVTGDKPAEPEAVERYLASKFGADLERVREAFEQLAASLEPAALAEAAWGLYEQFRPATARGQAGWGQAGDLDLARVRALAAR